MTIPSPLPPTSDPHSPIIDTAAAAAAAAGTPRSNGTAWWSAPLSDSPMSSPPTSKPVSRASSRSARVNPLHLITIRDANVTPTTYSDASPALMARSATVPYHPMSERSPSPHARLPQPSAMAEAVAQSRSPSGLIRRLSRGASNRLRRRASTQHSLRSLRAASAGPLLTRRRSDSNPGSDFGQDVSDLELDSTTEDPAEVPPVPYASSARNDGLGISIPRPSDASTRFEGGLADADSSTLQVGTDLIKLTAKKKKKVRFWLDSTSARVCWYGKATTKSFGLDDVLEVRKGVDSRNARDNVQVSPDEEPRLVTMVYADDRTKGRSTKTIHLLVPDPHIMDLWINAVNNVVAERVACMKALSLSAEKSEKGMGILWRQAMQAKPSDAEELFTLEDARRFCRQLQINCNSRTVESHFFKADVDRKGWLDYAQYREFVCSFKGRKDIEHLHRNIKHGLDSDLELDEFLSFLRYDQAVDVDKEREYWEGVFDKYARPAQNRATLPDAQPNLPQKTMSLQGFQNFLTSTYNSALVPIRDDATLDQPLNNYFISSSHNTYLLGAQVRGTSSVEGYIDALIGGCRCVEIDCWDGDNGRPTVTHGRTMTTKIPFEDCLSVIAKYAFHSSPYPLIISLEVHCSPEQQMAMVDLLYKYLEGMMITEPIVPNATSLPSPEELKHKILVKVKASDDDSQSQLVADISNGRSRARSLSSALYHAPSADKLSTHSTGTSSGIRSPSESGLAASVSTPRGSTTSGPSMTPTSSAEESDEGSVSATKSESSVRTSKIIPRLGRLGIYTQGVSFPKAFGFNDPKVKAFNHILSFSEDTFGAHCKKDGGNREALEKHNVNYLMRVYPGRRRIWSTNFNPLSAWRRGVQMAALNWQTYDVHQQVNRAMFSAGTDALGYVLKPEELRHPKHLPIADTIPEAQEKKEKKSKKIVRFTVEIISAQRLPRPRDANPDAGMNPYIEFEMYAADDKALGNAIGEGGTDASAPDGSSGVGSPLRKRTKVIIGNGFDPIYKEEINMAVVTKHPSLIFVRWTVWHQPDGRKPTSPNNVQLATFTAKLSSLQQGFRHLPLYNPQGEKYQEAKLFVRIRKEAPIPVHEEDPAYGMMVPSFTSSPKVDGRPDRPWPVRLFSRTSSTASSGRRRDVADGDEPSVISRTASMDRDSTA